MAHHDRIRNPYLPLFKAFAYVTLTKLLRLPFGIHNSIDGGDAIVKDRILGERRAAASISNN